MEIDSRPLKGHRSNFSHVALGMAAASMGVVLGQGLLAADLRAQGKLVPLFARKMELDAPYCIAYPPLKAGRPHLMAFIQWLRSGVIKSIGR